MLEKLVQRFDSQGTLLAWKVVVRLHAHIYITTHFINPGIRERQRDSTGTTEPFLSTKSWWNWPDLVLIPGESSALSLSTCALDDARDTGCDECASVPNVDRWSMAVLSTEYPFKISSIAWISPEVQSLPRSREIIRSNFFNYGKHKL